MKKIVPDIEIKKLNVDDSVLVKALAEYNVTKCMNCYLNTILDVSEQYEHIQFWKFHQALKIYWQIFKNE